MITELFYPKELRRLIRKYREEGTLNEVAVRNINKNIYITLILTLFLSAMLISDSQPSEIMYKLFGETVDMNLICGLSILFLFPLFLKWNVHTIFYDNVLPYMGKKINARVIKSGIWGLYNHRWKVLYESVDDRVKIRCRANVTAYPLKFDNLPKKGQLYSIYQGNIDKNKGMPDVDYFKKNYSLTTSIL